MTDKRVAQYLSAIGKKGGAAAKGAKKDRRVTLNDPDYYKKLAAMRKPKKRKEPCPPQA